MAFTRLPEHDLYALDEERLVAYGRAARDAGDTEAARTALALLVYGLQRDVARRVALRVPAEVVEEVSHDVLVRAIGSAFDGASVGELRSWLNTILDRTCHDYYRRRGRRPQETVLPGADSGEADRSGDPALALDSEAGVVEVQMIVEAILAPMSAPHRAVIELHVFAGLTAGEVCARIEGMREDNVAKIASRFRARLRAELDAALGGGR